MTSLKDLKNRTEKLNKATIIDTIAYFASTVASIELISIPTAMLLMYLAYKQGKTIEDIINCDEYKTLNDAYEDIIYDFIKLRKKLEMYDPLETFELYHFLVRNDMLSLTEDSIVYKIPYSEQIKGALTLNNHGNVASIQRMLLDICSMTELDAIYASGLSTGLEMHVNNSMLTPTDEEIQNILTFLSEEERIKFKENKGEITKSAITVDLVQRKPSFSEKRYGDTSIIQINDEDYSYFVDPGRSTVYELRENNTLRNHHGERLILKPKGTKAINKGNILQVLDVKKTKPLSEMLPYLTAIDLKLEANKDILEDFEKDIREKLITAEKTYQLIIR